MIRKTLTLICIFGGAGLGSQLPEYTQQYQQRLGGAITELQAVVDQFDADAEKLGISRQQALLTLAGSSQDFVRLRGDSMQGSIKRLDKLSNQQATFAEMEPALRPAGLFSHYDETLLRGTIEDFAPAIPLNSAGLIWGSSGAAVAWLSALLLGTPFTKRSSRGGRGGRGSNNRKGRRRTAAGRPAAKQGASNARAVRNQRKSPRF